MSHVGEEEKIGIQSLSMHIAFPMDVSKILFYFIGERDLSTMKYTAVEGVSRFYSNSKQMFLGCYFNRTSILSYDSFNGMKTMH